MSQEHEATPEQEQPEPVLSSFDPEGFVKYIKDNNCSFPLPTQTTHGLRSNPLLILSRAQPQTQLTPPRSSLCLSFLSIFNNDATTRTHTNTHIRKRTHALTHNRPKHCRSRWRRDQHQRWHSRLSIPWNGPVRQSTGRFHCACTSVLKRFAFA